MTLCDAHIHIVADSGAHPMIPNRSYTPAPASAAAIRELGAPLDIRRFVVVQPSFYGTDNEVLSGALREFGGAGRGVAVIDPDRVTPAVLGQLAAAGVVGLRINLYSTHGAAVPSAALQFTATAEVARRMGWHVQVIAHLPVLVAAEATLAASPVPVVIDHYGLPSPGDAEGETGQKLLALLRHEHVWIKLSAPYRSWGDPLAVSPDPAWLRAVLDAAADRCVWGSDWPHTPAHDAQPGNAQPAPYRPLDYAAVVAGFRNALPSAAVADRIMGANAERLYRFAA